MARRCQRPECTSGKPCKGNARFCDPECKRTDYNGRKSELQAKQRAARAAFTKRILARFCSCPNCDGSCGKKRPPAG